MKKINIVGIDEEIYYDETEMGMPIIMWVNDKVKNFYMTLNVKYGSIHTEFKTKGSKNFLKVPNGIAHFLEHMMFYMPDGQSAHEYFNDLGSSINACTTNDFTFYEVFGSNKFKDNLFTRLCTDALFYERKCQIRKRDNYRRNKNVSRWAQCEFNF